MSTRELLASSGAGIVLIDEQIITVSGNWLKGAGVKPTDRVFVDLWGAGGGGSYVSAGNSVFGVGGQGGAWLVLEFFAYELSSLVACVVGSGGNGASGVGADGQDGGFSSFGGVKAPGGKGGLASTGTGSNGYGHALQDIVTAQFSQYVSDPGYVTSNPAADAFPRVLIPNPQMKVELPSRFVWSSAYAQRGWDAKKGAGGCGGVVNASNNGLIAPSPTIIGGPGGAAQNIHANNAADGTAPGGGGGGKQGIGAARAGNGARGEIRVRVLRGAS